MKHSAFVIALLSAVLLPSLTAPGQSIVAGPVHRRATAFAISGPLVTMPAEASRSQPGRIDFLSVIATSPMPDALLSFNGIANEDNAITYSLLFAPADMIGAVGPNDYVQAVNSLLRVYDKSGIPRTPPVKLSTLFAPLNTTCALRNDGLPNVLYDQFADRWVISQVCSAFPPFRQMIAVSRTSDPTGEYYAYEFVMPNVKVNDFPKMGQWGDAYLMATDEFFGADFAGSGIFAFDRERILAGDPAAGYVYFSLGSDSPVRRRGALPADVDGMAAPPPTAPALFGTYTADEYGDAADAIRLWELSADFDDPFASTFSEADGSPINVTPFDPTSPFGRADIAQPPPGEYLDSQSDRIAHRLAYRNFGTHEALTVNQTVRSSAAGSPYRAGLRLYELHRISGGGFQPISQAAIGDVTSSRWIGAAAQDHEGNTALQYNFVADDKKVSIHYTGRLATDPPNELLPEKTLIEGTGVQRAFGFRWGEYAGMSVDPFEGCTFWLTNAYYTLASQKFSELGWLTRIAAFKFDACEPLQTSTLNGTVTDAATSRPIGGAIVSVADFSRHSMATGNYGPLIIPPGQVIVTGAAKGYRTASMPVTALPGGTNSVGFALEPIPVISAVEMFISAESCKIDGGADPGETISLDVTLRNDGARSAIGLTAQMLQGVGIESPGPVQDYGIIPPGAEAVRTFTFTLSSSLKCGAVARPLLRLTEGGEQLADIVLALQTGKQAIAFSENFDGVTAPDLPAGWLTTSSPNHQLWRTSTARIASGANAVFSPAPHQMGINELVSPAFEITSPDAQISFRNWYELETTFLRNRLYDGSVLEIQIGGGEWQDILAAGGSFLEGGYDGIIDTCCSNPLGGRSGWSGRSGINQMSEFIDTIAAVPASAAGKSVRLRWRIGTDIGSFREGQYLDDILVTDGYTCSCGAPQSFAPFDFDGDGRTDLSVARPNSEPGAPDFRVINSSKGELSAISFGSTGDVPANADFDGDGRTDIAIYRPSTGEWWIMQSSDGTVRAMRFGLQSDLPVPADFDGDGRSDMAVYRPVTGEWYIYRSSDGTVMTVRFGVAEDQPLPADFDGDGRSDIAVFRPSNGVWYIYRSSDAGVTYTAFGLPGDRPLATDFDGDGRADIAVYRPASGIWYLLGSTAGFSAVRFGVAEDQPLTADFDGDGLADVAVYRPSSRIWYYLQSSNWEVRAFEFGGAGEVPLPGIYVGQ
ncbi:MAG TPA: FG-GAP-like repeat-containing protein [Pyrinomonadaceae bacterium]|nr:FG-GAP-like repeat-containing protein [Pyrinomonadaceae bacterium]